MEKEEDQKKTKRPVNLNWDMIYPKNENGPPAEKEEDQKKTKRPLNLNWDMIYPKNENGPPAEAVVVGGHFDDDKKQREADLSEATDHQLEEKIKRLESVSSGFLRLPDKGEKLRKSLKLHKDELERRNRIRLRKEAEFEKSSQFRSSGLPGACNSYGSEAPSQAHSKSKFVSSFIEHLDDEPDPSQAHSKSKFVSGFVEHLDDEPDPSQAHSKSKFVSSFVEHLDDEPDPSTRISVNPVSKKLSLVDRDNHRNTSSKGLLMNNGGREIEAMKISPQYRGISGHDEHRSSIGAQNTIDSSRFYHSHLDGNSSVRSSKRTATNNDQQIYYCLCGAGLCNVFTSHSESNPGRLFITCPNRVGNNGCGLWQWHDEVKMCPCKAGICRIQRCKTSNTLTNVGRWSCTCPRSSVQVKGCGFFAWLDPLAEKKEETSLEATTSGSSQMEELRKYVEMKRTITIEVCDAILEKMKELKLEK